MLERERQGRSRFDRLDSDVVRSRFDLALALDLASISLRFWSRPRFDLRGPEPMLDRACCYVLPTNYYLLLLTTTTTTTTTIATTTTTTTTTTTSESCGFDRFDDVPVSILAPPVWSASPKGGSEKGDPEKQHFAVTWKWLLGYLLVGSLFWDPPLGGSDFRWLKPSLEKVTDGKGTPDPNPKHSVNVRF